MEIKLSDHFTYKRLLRFVLPSIIMMIFTSIYGVVDGFFVSNYAGKTEFAAVNLIMPFPMLLGGFGFMIGTGTSFELKNVFKKSISFNIVAGIIMTISAVLLSGLLAKIFVGYDKELYEMTRIGFAIYSISFLIMGINIFASAFFTALGNGGISALISFLRTLLFQMVAVLVLPIFFELNGIWMDIVVAEGCAIVVSSLFLVTKRRRYGY